MLSFTSPSMSDPNMREIKMELKTYSHYSWTLPNQLLKNKCFLHLLLSTTRNKTVQLLQLPDVI
jgi:hypothetical protein